MDIIHCWVIGKAHAASEEPGKLNLMADFPSVHAPGTAFGQTLGEVQSEPWWKGSVPIRTVGRVLDAASPHLNLPLWIDATNNPLYVDAVTTPGIRQISGLRLGEKNYGNFSPPDGVVPYIGIVGCDVEGLSVAQGIHTHAQYRVISAWVVEGDPVPQIADWGPNEALGTTRWNQIAAGLLALGMPQSVIDLGGPDKTPYQVVKFLINYLRTL